MFEILIESKHKPDKTRVLGVGFISVTLHTALIAAAIVANAKVGQSGTPVWRDATMVVLYDSRLKSQVQIGSAIKRCPGLLIPPSIPTPIPPSNPWEGLYPGSHSGSGVEGGVYPESLVEEKPSLLSAPQPRYPALLKQAGIQGRVLIHAIIDTSGRAESNSVTIVESPHPAFDPGSRNWMLRARFRPARVHGRAVRALVQVPLEYRITAR